MMTSLGQPTYTQCWNDKSKQPRYVRFEFWLLKTMPIRQS